jgi:hypothetical protein
VGHCDFIEAQRFGHGGKKFIAQSPRSILQIPSAETRLSGNVGATGFKFKMEISRKCSHEAFVFVRCRSTQLMVEMQRMNGNSKLRLQLRENPQHGYRIRPAGNTNANAVAGPNHGVPGNCVAHPFVEVLIHPKKMWIQIALPGAAFLASGTNLAISNYDATDHLSGEIFYRCKWNYIRRGR